MESSRSSMADDKSEKPPASTSSRTNIENDVEKNADAQEQTNQEQLKREPTTDDKLAYLVKWDDGEKENPYNFTTARKSWITFQLGMLALTASLASSITGPAQSAIAKEFHVSVEATVLTISLYVLGFAIGPSFWGPISETYGRQVSLLPAVFCLGLWSIGTAVSRNATSVFITRFFGGLFGSGPVANVAAALGDMYTPKVRGTAVTFYAVAVVGGPTIGPVIGSALTVKLGWRWTEYITAFFSFLMVVVSYFCMPELHGPVLLKRKAARLRKETGDQRYWHPHEKEKMNLQNIITKYLSRPIRMLFTEPMVSAIALYASFVFGILYLTLEVFPIVYREDRGWGPIVSTLPFLGLFVGVLFAVVVNLANQPRYARLVAANNGKAVPEGRLLPMALGGFLFVLGIFWFVWTAHPKFHWAIPTVATLFIGAGFNIIFQQCINFLVDTYGMYAASAVSANTILRSLMACGLPLAARPMFRHLGVGPAGSILGAVAALAVPVPFIFMRYGLKLRQMSKFAPIPKS